MKIMLIVIGKTDAGYLQQGMDIYLKRLKFYTPFEMKVIPDLKNMRNLTPDEQKEKEGQQILLQLEGRKEVYLLDEGGQEFTSRQLAGFLEKKIIAACRELTFIVGGPYGFSKQVEDMAIGKISLSKLTFSHQMVRLLFAEQLYRAFTIIKAEPYHHD